MAAAAAAAERGVMNMGIEIKPSDLYFKYHRNKPQRDEPKFSGKPDPRPYDRDDLYEVIPMLGAVMDALDCRDANVLHRLEELAGDQMPRFIRSREDVFDFLLSVMRDTLGLEPDDRP
jgi:hypothetical protein